MMNYRLSFYGLAGFDTKGFDTKEEALKWAKEYSEYGLATPEDLMKYDAIDDTYKIIGSFSKVK